MQWGRTTCNHYDRCDFTKYKKNKICDVRFIIIILYRTVYFDILYIFLHICDILNFNFHFFFFFAFKCK